MRIRQIPIAVIGASMLSLCSLHASSSGTDYSIVADSENIAGATLSSSNYSVVASVGEIGGVSSETASGYLVKSGFVGQIYDIVGVIPTTPASRVNERAVLQLGVAQVLDDSTLLALSPRQASWSVVNGPVSSISSSGVATAATVYQDTTASIRAAWQGFSGTLSLTVLNINSDDYGTYAGDGLPDDWQQQYFGLTNPAAAPDKDATGSGQNNLFKYVAGLDPTDKTAVFRLNVQTISGQPNQKQIVFSPVLTGRSYTVCYKTELTNTAWTPLTNFTQSDSGQQRTVTDADAGGRKFYRVQISKP